MKPNEQKWFWHGRGGAIDLLIFIAWRSEDAWHFRSAWKPISNNLEPSWAQQTFHLHFSFSIDFIDFLGDGSFSIDFQSVQRYCSPYANGLQRTKEGKTEAKRENRAGLLIDGWGNEFTYNLSKYNFILTSIYLFICYILIGFIDLQSVVICKTWWSATSLSLPLGSFISSF